ncbi:MAG: pimeloyl-ACP methyl ester carboxylesterase [Saprospiraceae bacterium]|jgi:pimeloyl-ACP methyl ester carboxylesterase
MSLKKIVLLPGTLCTADLFAQQKRTLSDIAECVVGNISSSDNLSEVAANILSENKGNFSIIGLSYGGIIAFEILRQAPERIDNLILMNTNYKKPSEATRAAQQRFLGMSQLGEFREIMTDFLKDAMLHPENAKLQSLRDTILKMALDTGRVAFFNQIKAQLNRPDSTEDLPNINCPTLIITGREDKVCTPELHEEMASMIPNAELEIVEKCGHLSTLEQPEEINRIIRKWIKK